LVASTSPFSLMHDMLIRVWKKTVGGILGYSGPHLIPAGIPEVASQALIGHAL
jgi:hypothetical protein